LVPKLRHYVGEFGPEELGVLRQAAFFHVVGEDGVAGEVVVGGGSGDAFAVTATADAAAGG
jgi:hypothetical protein